MLQDRDFTVSTLVQQDSSRGASVSSAVLMTGDSPGVWPGMLNSLMKDMISYELTLQGTNYDEPWCIWTADPSAGTGWGHVLAESVSDLPGGLPQCSGPGSLQPNIRPGPQCCHNEGSPWNSLKTVPLPHRPTQRETAHHGFAGLKTWLLILSFLFLWAPFSLEMSCRCTYNMTTHTTVLSFDTRLWSTGSQSTCSRDYGIYFPLGPKLTQSGILRAK